MDWLGIHGFAEKFNHHAGQLHLAAMAVPEYIERLMQGCSVTVKDTPNCGRGLFATSKPFDTGGAPPMVFSEGPLGGIVQMSGSTRRRGGACCLCGHVLGSPAWQLRLLTDEAFESSDVLDEPLSDIVKGKPLFGNGTPLFCSSACHNEYERILGRLRARRTAAQKFARYARKVQCAFYMLAMKLICWCLAEEEAAPLQALCRRPYWDAVDMPPKIDVQSFKGKLAKEAETSRQLALKALGGRDVLPSDWDFLDESGYVNLIGALCCNCTVVVYMSPVLQHILQVTGMNDCAAKEAALTTLEPWIRALIATPPPDDTSETEKAWQTGQDGLKRDRDALEGRSRNFLEHSKRSAVLLFLDHSSFSWLRHLSTHGPGRRMLLLLFRIFQSINS